MPLAATPTARTPGGRIKRSAIQAILGFIPGIVVMLNQDHLSLYKAGKYGGTSALAVLAIAVIQNVAEQKGWLKPNAAA